jgi:hypothetical protein
VEGVSRTKTNRFSFQIHCWSAIKVKFRTIADVVNSNLV